MFIQQQKKTLIKRKKKNQIPFWTMIVTFNIPKQKIAQSAGVAKYIDCFFTDG